MSPAIQQRCWNHQEREASCRCPVCARSFCRECVTEHQKQLVCASCLQKVARQRSAGRSFARRMLPTAMAAGGLLLAWLVYYGAGQFYMESQGHQESSWEDR